MKAFAELTEKEILALAIALEEEHGRIYADYAHGLAEAFPASAKVFTDMAAEENEHRRWLIGGFRHDARHDQVARRWIVDDLGPGTMGHGPITHAFGNRLRSAIIGR